MRLKHTVLVLDEIESERVERERRPKPDESGGSRIESGLEVLSIARPYSAVYSIGRYDEIGVEHGVIVCFRAESQSGAELGRSGLQNLKQLFPRDSTEPVPPRRDAPTVNEHIDVIPVREVLRYRFESRLVGGAKVFQRLVGEHNAPPKCVIGPVSLENGDTVPCLLLH